MSQDRMMQAIGRIERALGRLEMIDFQALAQSAEPSDLLKRHEQLRKETQSAIGDLDHLLSMVKG